jgi:CHAT domain-containing protein
LRVKVASQELRASYFASEHQRYDFYIDLLMQMHKQLTADGTDAAALEASERARARSLAEILGEARADIRQGVEPALLERERSLLQSLNAKLDRQMRPPSGKPDKQEAEALAKEIRDLTTAHEELQTQIRIKSPRYAALTQPQPLGLKEIQEQVLDDDSLLLEYSLGDEHSYLWAVTRSTMHSYELPKSGEIERAARHLYELLVARQRRPGETDSQYQARVRQADTQYWPRAAALSQMLLAPVADQLGTKRLLIVAEGALQYVPFEGLPVPGKGDGGTLGRGDAVPLMVEHEIVYLPSASVLAVLRDETRNRRAASRAVAVIADPVFEADDPRVAVKPEAVTARRGGKTIADSGTRRPGDTGEPPLRVATAPRRPVTVSPPSAEGFDLQRALRDVRTLRQGRLGFPRLLSSRDEAQAIMAVVPEGAGMKATDFKANRATATSPELGQYRIVHFATHGLFDSEHPERSGLVLSLVDEQGQRQDGFLGIHDIYNLNLPVDLVVLSACNTALGKEVRGEGLMGIVRGFMYAGAARVVASLWKVEDEATAELMKRFYQRMLQDGMRPAAALRAAQVDIWRQKRWSSPFYWAAFTLQGEWK